MRVLDFIAQDMRRAASGSVANGGQTLTLRLPDYLDESLNPPTPRTPTIVASGTVTYWARAIHSDRGNTRIAQLRLLFID